MSSANAPTSLFRRHRRGWITAAAGVAVLALAAGGTALAVAGPSGPGIALTLDETHCGAPPASLPAGPILFELDDRARDSAAVYVVDPDGGEVFAENQSLPAGLTQPLSLTLTSGTYALRCVFTNGVVETSSPFTVTGHVNGAAPGVKPMPDLDMQGPVTAYRNWVQAQLPILLAACQKLDADAARGDLAAARTDWLPAHLDYERLGAAYNSFGDFDDAIDGMADGLPQGTSTPDWTGFFSIEYALWHGAPAARVRAGTKQLVASVEGLIQDFPSEEIDPGDLPLRTHEILENALQFQLTAIADYGSGTTLATVYANIQGTAEIISTLTQLVEQRDPGLTASLRADLAGVQAELLAARSADGAWTPVGTLTTAQRQRLDGELGALLEELSQVPDLLTPRTSA